MSRRPIGASGNGDMPSALDRMIGLAALSKYLARPKPRITRIKSECLVARSPIQPSAQSGHTFGRHSWNLREDLSRTNVIWI